MRERERKKRMERARERERQRDPTDLFISKMPGRGGTGCEAGSRSQMTGTVLTASDGLHCGETSHSWNSNSS